MSAGSQIRDATRGKGGIEQKRGWMRRWQPRLAPWHKLAERRSLALNAGAQQTHARHVTRERSFQEPMYRSTRAPSFILSARASLGGVHVR